MEKAGDCIGLTVPCGNSIPDMGMYLEKRAV